MFTPARILALAPVCPPANAEVLAVRLEHFAHAYEVDRPLRAAHLMAQLCHESGGFTRMIENLNYSAEQIARVWPRLAPRASELAHNQRALANAAYANRMGNGGETSDDGWRFRGRGLIQLTGRENYSERGQAISVDLIEHPELAAHPETAVEIALSFWKVRRCNVPADRDDIEGVTRLINGPAMAGIQERRILTTHAKKIFTADEPLIA